MESMLIADRLARVSAGRPWLVVAAWVVLAIVGGYFATGVANQSA